LESNIKKSGDVTKPLGESGPSGFAELRIVVIGSLNHDVELLLEVVHVRNKLSKLTSSLT